MSARQRGRFICLGCGSARQRHVTIAAIHLQGNWWRFSHRTELSDELCSVAGIDLSLKNMQLEDIKKAFSRSNTTEITPVKKTNG